MAFNYNGSKGNTQPMVEINTTPLVDVMLVLLVIFIITAPLLNQAVPIDLPQVDATRIEDQPRTVQVAIDAQNRIFVDAKPVAIDALAAYLAPMTPRNLPAPELHLRADRGTRYERVAQVMAIAARAGISKIAFVTEAATAGDVPR
jgi:biopolymer transport protein ExbD